MKPLFNIIGSKILFLFGILFLIQIHPWIGNRMTQFYNRLKTFTSMEMVSSEDFSPNYNVVFHLWTRYTSKSDEGKRIIVGSERSLLEGWFVGGRNTYVIIHGFTSSGLAPWVIQMKDALLHKESCNVISVDWQSGNVVGEYYVIQSRVPAVGEDLSTLLKFLKEIADLDFGNVHLIGHSLGAHVAGFAAKSLDGQIGRITGLDPASYGYWNKDSSKRLDKTDAQFVDIIHTNACLDITSTLLFRDCYGLNENIGDIDFWPNGGEKQLPCQQMDHLEESTSDIPSYCDHSIGINYFIESISRNWLISKFQARPCESWLHFLNNSCQVPVFAQSMGFNAKQHYKGKFYLLTERGPPFSKTDYLCSFFEILYRLSMLFILFISSILFCLCLLYLDLK